MKTRDPLQDTVLVVLQQIARLVSWDFRRTETAYKGIIESSISQGLEPRQVIKAIVASNRCGVDAWTTLSATIELKVRADRTKKK